MDICSRLGQNLRRLREEQGLSQEQFADEAGIHRTYVSDLERRRQNPTTRIIEKLASYLAVSAGRLLD